MLASTMGGFREELNDVLLANAALRPMEEPGVPPLLLNEFKQSASGQFSCLATVG